jgi:riboflavin synthase
MFTGIVEELGTVESLDLLDGDAARLTIRGPLVTEDAGHGDSISVNGCCLTVVDTGDGTFTADVMRETLRRTSLGAVEKGSTVNLERAVKAHERLGGHIVQGHVDGTGELLSFEELGDGNWWLNIRVAKELDRWLVYKGSVAVDGISLTVASIEDGVLGITIIPHTYEMTRLRDYRPGARVNIECDILAKHVDKLMALRSGAAV